MLRTITLSLLVGLISVTPSPGQEIAKPGPEHTKLKEYEGQWDAVMEMGGQKSKASATYKSICGGMWIASDFEGDLGGIKFQGHGLDGYDQAKKKYVGVWVDSMTSAPLNFEGNYDSKTKLLVMTGESRDAQGKPQKFKTTTETKSKDQFLFKMYMVQPNGKEELSFTIDYTRRK